MATILIVEDQAETRKLMAIAMKGAKHTLLEAPDGLSALSMALDSKPDVMLLDVNMPNGPDGFKVCERIKATPELAGIFVILITGLSEPEHIEAGRQNGADAYFVKPFRLSRLVEVIENHAELKGRFLLEDGR